MKNIDSTPSLEKKEFGKNIHTVIDFRRHAIPGKTPEGMSADYLTPEGQEMAGEMGKGVQEANVAGYGSPKLRAQETADLAIGNVNESVQVVNKKLANIPAREKYSNQRQENKFRIKTKKELDALDNFGNIMPLAKKWAAAEKENGSRLDMYSLIVQYYLDNPTICEENNVSTPREAAAQIAERVAVELKMTERFFDDSDVRLINVTHGPKLEPFLKEILDFEDLEEIGGAVGVGEGIEFEVDIDAEKKKKVTMILRDKRYELKPYQLDLISKLSEEYREKAKVDEK